VPSSSPQHEQPPAAAFRSAAAAQGLNRLWVVPRAAVEARYASLPASIPRPSALHPGYRTALVLVSAGPDFWRGFRASLAPGAAVPDPTAHALDRYTEAVVEALADALRAADPGLCTVYPFHHARQVLGFARLLGDASWLGAAPFGVQVEPQAGPWWALRGALLTGLDWPPDPPSAAGAESPCIRCPAPCVTACPAGAVSKAGLDWHACAPFRLGGPTCAETCLARLACPVAPHLRYDADAIAHHYRASLRELAALHGR